MSVQALLESPWLEETVTALGTAIGTPANVARPGNYEVVMGFPFREFLYDLCGGPPAGRKSIAPTNTKILT